MIVMRCVAIKSDEQLREWFNLNLENGVVQIDAQINNFDGLLQFSPIKHRLHPIVRERVREKVLQTPSQPTQEGTTTTKEDKKKLNHVMRRRLVLMRSICTLTVILFLH
jgi:hypothetical protein